MEYLKGFAWAMLWFVIIAAAMMFVNHQAQAQQPNHDAMMRSIQNDLCKRSTFRQYQKNLQEHRDTIKMFKSPLMADSVTRQEKLTAQTNHLLANQAQDLLVLTCSIIKYHGKGL